MKTLLLILVLSAQGLWGQTLTDYQTFIASHEGCKLERYKDADGWSIGYGHHAKTLSSIPSRIDKKTALRLLSDDTAKALSITKSQIRNFDSLPRDAKLVIVGLTYNVGSVGLSRFKKMIAALESDNIALAADELRQSKRFGQIGERGPKEVKILQGAKN